MIAAALLIALAGSPADPAPIQLSPSHVVIAGLTPGSTGAADVSVTNNSGQAVEISVTGRLSSPNGPVGEEDLLQVSLAGCAGPWAGVPVEPTVGPVSTRCDSGEVEASSGSLAAVPLEAGDSIHLLISAGLGEHAGPGAQGQTWSASFDVTALATDPAPAPVLALTGADTAGFAAAAIAAVAGGVALRRHTKGTRR
ncbi:hypothetical protein [Cellulomonas sp. C5510]|uniref:hypothetical protein n=1 Tax=Cellulomonas sp. C5510 TaxID=2871170 RepID=UPI001C98BB9E|nr:hypothetical protein [Cellulomonas sp. C5510]QZN87801.1 hypothetical protein K5O09_18585 [Cellulomonas sp. C5510]